MKFGDSYATGPPRKGFAFFVPNAEPGNGVRTYQGDRGLQIAAQQSINLEFDLSICSPLTLASLTLAPGRRPNSVQPVAPASDSGFKTGAVIP